MSLIADGNRYQQQVQPNIRPEGIPHTIADAPPSTDSPESTPSTTQAESNQVREGLSNQPVFIEPSVDFGDQIEIKQNMARAQEIIGRLTGELSPDDRTELSMELSRLIENSGFNDQQLLQLGNTIANHLRDSEGVDRSLNSILGQVLDKVDASAPDSNIMSLTQVFASQNAAELADMLKNGASPAEMIAKVNEFTSQLEGLDQQALTAIARDIGKLMAEYSKPVDSGLAPLLIDVLRRAESAPEREGFNLEIPEIPEVPEHHGPWMPSPESRALPPEIVQQLQEALQDVETYDTTSEFLQQHILQLREELEGSTDNVDTLRQQLDEAQQVLEQHTQELQETTQELEAQVQELEPEDEELASVRSSLESIQEQLSQEPGPEQRAELREQLTSMASTIQRRTDDSLMTAIGSMDIESIIAMIEQQIAEFIARM